jgi:hypothetical protein
MYLTEKYTGLKCNRFLRGRVYSVVFYLITAVHKFDCTSVIKRLMLFTRSVCFVRKLRPETWDRDTCCLGQSFTLE